MNESNQELIMSKGGVGLLSMTASHAEDPQTLQMVVGVIANLCDNDKLQVKLRSEGGIKALLGMVKCGHPDVLAQVMLHWIITPSSRLISYLPTSNLALTTSPGSASPEKLVLKDLDIVKAANGTAKAFNALYYNISVLDTRTVEIRFYYAAKGTTAAPQRGIYGPLISAISVESDFSPPPHHHNKLTNILVSFVASLMGLILISCIIFWRHRVQSKPSREEILGGIDLQSGMFIFAQIVAATNSFDIANMIGKGGSGTVAHYLMVPILQYGFERKNNETILVFDLGGGTFDVSVLEVGDGVFEVLSTSGDTHLGGDEFDKMRWRVVDWLAADFKRNEGIDLLKDKQTLQRLIETAEKAKMELSSLT